MRVAALAAGLALGVPAPAAAMPHEHGADAAAGPMASIAYAAFAPPATDVLVGQSVTWTNDSLRDHAVTADDGSFDSPRLRPGEPFGHRFDAVGETPYYCRLHTFMRGVVHVHEVLLDPLAEASAPGVQHVLSGRTALQPGTRVGIDADAGAGWAEVATATVDDAGAIASTVAPRTTMRYRARTAGDVSPVVELRVLDRKVSARASTRRRRATVLATVTPAGPRATVVLQLKLRRHFGWWPVARGRTGPDGRVRLRLPVGGRVPARVVVTLADGATVLATSRTLSVGAGPS